MRVSADASRIAGGNAEQTRLWDVRSGGLLATVAGAHPLFSPDGSRFVTRGGGAARVFSATDGEPRQRVLGSEAAFRADGSLWVLRDSQVVDGDSEASLGGVREPRGIGQLLAEPGLVLVIAGTSIQVWRPDASSMEWSEDFTLLDNRGAYGIFGVGILAGGRFLAVTAESIHGTAILDARTGKRLRTLPISMLAMSEQGTVGAHLDIEYSSVQSRPGRVDVWPATPPRGFFLKRPAPLMLSETVNHRVTGLALSPGGERLAIARDDGVSVLEVGRGTAPVRAGDGIPGLQYSHGGTWIDTAALAFAPDGSWLAMAHAEEAVRIVGL